MELVVGTVVYPGDKFDEELSKVETETMTIYKRNNNYL